MKSILSISFSWILCSTLITAQDIVVSVDKMNVLYVGVDNPISVAVPGYTSNKVSAVLSENGTLTSVAPGKYIANFSSPDMSGQTKVEVYAQLQNGSKKLMGEVNFRVKRVPDPVAMVGSYKGGAIKTSLFKVQKGLSVTLENFDYDIRFSVVGFEMTYASKGNLVELATTGALFTQGMLDIIAQSKPGDNFYFDNIKVRGPDGTTRRLPGIVFKLI